jgi:hypothetical protein
LGFPKIIEFGPDGEHEAPLRGIIYGFGDVLFEISEGHIAVKPKVFEQEISSSKISMMINVESLIPVLDACEQNSISIAVEPRKFPWGQFGVVLKDPDGFVLVFLSEVSEDEEESLKIRAKLPLDRKEPDYSAENLAAVAKKKLHLI